MQTGRKGLETDRSPEQGRTRWPKVVLPTCLLLPGVGQQMAAKGALGAKQQKGKGYKGQKGVGRGQGGDGPPGGKLVAVGNCSSRSAVGGPVIVPARSNGMPGCLSYNGASGRLQLPARSMAKHCKDGNTDFVHTGNYYAPVRELIINPRVCRMYSVCLSLNNLHTYSMELINLSM